MNRRRFLKTSTGVAGAALIPATAARAESVNRTGGSTSGGPGPEIDATTPSEQGAIDLGRGGQPAGTDQPQQETEDTVVLSGTVSGNFSSEVGKIRVGPPSNDNITGDILPDGSFAVEVPMGEVLDIAYIQTDGGDGRVTLDGNPDVYYINRMYALESDHDLGEVSIPEGHLLEPQVVGPDDQGLADVQVGVRSLGPDSPRWWQVYTQSNADGYFQYGDSEPGIEVAGEVELVVFGNESDDRLPDSNATEQLTVTEPRSETIVVDPITIRGRMVFPDGSPAVDQEVLIFTDESTTARAPTDSDGAFTVQLPQAPAEIEPWTYGVRYYRDGLVQNPDEPSPIDGFVDMYAGPEIDGSMDEDVGDVILPEGWLTQVRVVDQEGEGVSDALVTYTHVNEEADTRARLLIRTTKDGRTPISGRTGLYLSETVQITVSPPNTDQFADTDVERELSVDGDTEVEIELLTDELAPYRNEDGEVDSSGLIAAIEDWQEGEISGALLVRVITAWQDS